MIRTATAIPAGGQMGVTPPYPVSRKSPTRGGQIIQCRQKGKAVEILGPRWVSRKNNPGRNSGIHSPLGVAGMPSARPGDNPRAGLNQRESVYMNL